MNNDKMIVEIEGNQVERIEYKGQPVITLKMVDELHKRPEGTARKSFNRHKNKLVVNEDFFNVPYKEWTQIPAVHNMDSGDTGQRNNMIFLTESGYLMVVKPFGDDLAWKVQRALVRNYFVAKEMLRGASSGYDPEMKAFLKEATALLSSFREELHSFREELDHVRKERDLFRDKLFILQDHLIEKGTAHPKVAEITDTCSCSKSSEIPSKYEHAHQNKYEHEHEILKDFIGAWWKAFGNDRVGVSHLYPLIEKHDIPLNLGGGTDRSRSIRLGRKLTGICGQRIGDHIVTGAKKWRNVKRYRLKIMPMSKE